MSQIKNGKIKGNKQIKIDKIDKIDKNDKIDKIVNNDILQEAIIDTETIIPIMETKSVCEIIEELDSKIEESKKSYIKNNVKQDSKKRGCSASEKL